jgi:acyl-CoA synthetase (AMP-forming)/AMP-acid ligase II
VAGTSCADVWEAIADVQPDALAQVQGTRRFTWREFDERADGLAAALLEIEGLEHQAKVAQYLQNCPEYIESVYGAWKAGLVPVNTNFRYTDDELVYLWENADAVAVVFHGSFTETIERIRSQVPKVQRWFWVDDASAPCPSWATPYEDLMGHEVGRQSAPWGRSGDDLYMLYTGGTTGMPKGTMWRQDDIFWLANAGGLVPPYPDGADVATMAEQRRSQGPGLTVLPACPLMHGTGALGSFGVLHAGGSVVLLENRSFDPHEMFDLVEREAVDVVVIVGDAFAKPMLNVLTDNADRWDLSSLRVAISSGVMWSEPVKEGLLEHLPSMILADLLGSSEALGMGASASIGSDAAKTAKFSLGPHAVVVGDDGKLVEPGSASIGRLGIKGRTPVGYYKDPAKSAQTFPVIDGVRYSLPGDFATVEADGSITLLGRGSVCINTGGEKVFPEEVEEVLKLHAAVHDAVAVAVPDSKFGEVVAAMIELEPHASVAEAEVIAHVRSRLASFKAPKHVFIVDTIGRAANAKVDYKRLKAEAIARLAQ